MVLALSDNSAVVLPGFDPPVAPHFLQQPGRWQLLGIQAGDADERPRRGGAMATNPTLKFDTVLGIQLNSHEQRVERLNIRAKN